MVQVPPSNPVEKSRLSILFQKCLTNKLAKTSKSFYTKRPIMHEAIKPTAPKGYGAVAGESKGFFVYRTVI